MTGDKCRGTRESEVEGLVYDCYGLSNSKWFLDLSKFLSISMQYLHMNISTVTKSVMGATS